MIQLQLGLSDQAQFSSYSALLSIVYSPSLMNPPLDPASLKGISHDDKWKSLEPILRDLYQRHTVKEIAKQMKDAYGFEAK